MTKSKKILFVGDSHTAMIKHALTENTDLTNACDFDFFVQASKADHNLGGLNCADDYCWAESPRKNHLVKTTSGADRFRPDDYDAVVLVGLRTELPYALWDGFHWGLTDQVDKQNISAATYEFALCDYIEQHALAIGVAQKIRLVSNCPILLVPNPYIDAAIREKAIKPSQEIIIDIKVSAGRITNGSSNLEDWKAALAKAMAPHKVDILFQPDSTVMDDIFTRPEFTGSLLTPPDLRHMNGAYGEMVIEQALSALE